MLRKNFFQSSIFLGELPLAVQDSEALFLGPTGSTAQCRKATERPGGLAVWASATRLE